MTAALYLRMSTDKQENSIDSQRKLLKAYAQTNKIKIIDEYVDEGISGRIAEKRPSFMRMIDDSSKELFNAILVYDSSRFARNLEESIVYKSILRKNNVQLISITEPTLDEDSALITDAMLGALNEMYSRKLSKSVKRGMVYQAQKGEYPVPPPFGYNKSNGIMAVNNKEAEIVRKVFQLFVDMPSWYKIALTLNDLEVPKRNATKWETRDIVRMINNPAYIGKINYSGHIYDGTHEPIIDTALWNKSREILAMKPKIKRNPGNAYSHWLSGLMKCAQCGSPLNHIKYNNGCCAYRCSGYSNAKCKYSNFITVSNAELLFRRALAELIAESHFTNYSIKITENHNEDELTLMESKLRRIQSKLQRHKDAYATGIDSIEEYKENKSKCVGEENEIVSRIAELKKGIGDERQIELKQKIINLIQYLYIEGATIEQKNYAVKMVVSRIIIDKNAGKFKVFYFCN